MKGQHHEQCSLLVSRFEALDYHWLASGWYLDRVGLACLRGKGQHHEHHRLFVSPVAALDLRLGESVRPWGFKGFARIAGCRRELRPRRLQLPSERCRLRCQGG